MLMLEINAAKSSLRLRGTKQETRRAQRLCCEKRYEAKGGVMGRELRANVYHCVNV